MYLDLYKNNNNTWVLDIEADGLKPTVVWCVCLKNLNTREEKVFTDAGEFKAWLSTSSDRKFIGHNLISFDIPVLNRLWDTGIAYTDCVDCLILSYLFNPVLEGGHSLDAWGGRLGFPKQDFSDWSRLTDQMVEYCKNDVELTRRVYIALSDKLNKYKCTELACLIEHKIRVVVDEQQRNGFYFDKERASEFRLFLRQRQSELSDQIQVLFPDRRTEVARHLFRRRKDGSPFASYVKHVDQYNDIEFSPDGNEYIIYDLIPFNIGSPKQRVERLLELGWKPEKFTEKGFPKVDEDALVKFADSSGRKEVSAMAEWLVLQGRASMLDTWFNNLGDDSRMHGRVFTCGASTRRMTHSDPNTANIPSGAKAKYGHECRSFWSVRPASGLCLVGYDAAGLETAGLCHYLNNPEATSILLKPKPNDIHTANARRLTEALGRDIDREWGAKTSWYAWLYGAYPPKLGTIVKGPPSDGEIVIDTFFRNVPGLKQLIDGVQYEFKHYQRRLETIDGGFVWAPSSGASLNYLIQSCGSILMKLAAIVLDEEAKRIGLPFKLVGSIHDEGQLEVEEKYAEQLGKLAVWSIEEAGRQLKLNVPVTGDYKIGSSWAMTH